MFDAYRSNEHIALIRIEIAIVKFNSQNYKAETGMN